MLTLNDGRAELWQWDTGRKLTVDADCSQVHFSNKVFGRSIDVDAVDGVAVIPDILLQTDKELMAWAFVGTAKNGYTKISKVFKVNKRNKPADYVFTQPDQTTLGEILGRIEDLENRPSADISKEDIQDAVNEYLDNNPVSVNEKDPTVPDWAKRPQKPTYTAGEVGAMPAETTIPAPYVLPIATPEKLGGVKPVAKGADMTQKVGVDELGGLWTAPGGAGGSEVWMKIHDATIEEDASKLKVTFASTKMKHIRVQVDTAAAEADTSYGQVNILTDDGGNEVARNKSMYLGDPPPRKDARSTFVEAKIIIDKGMPSIVIENTSITKQGNVRFPQNVLRQYHNNEVDSYGNALNPYITGVVISSYGMFVAGTKIKIWGIPV